MISYGKLYNSYEGFEISKKNIKNLGISESFHLI